MNKNKISILLYYKFVNIQKPYEIKLEQENICKDLGLNGRILIANEGINGSVSGSKKQTQKYIEFMNKHLLFSGIMFKEELSTEHPFKRFSAHVKKEIVRFEKSVDIKNTGNHLSPKEFLETLEKNKDVILIDARNDYEYEVGHFKDAINPETETFTEFPAFVEKLKGKEDKKVLMYCTGGIRCEKASAYMKEKGFKDVNQLEGGILNFCKQFPNTQWKGKLFVFDKRLISDVNSSGEIITNCAFCKKDYDQYRNCKNSLCDKLIIQCKECQEKMNKCCSKQCKEVYEKHLREKQVTNQGKTRNQTKY